MANEEELRKEREHQEDLQVLQDLRPVDDDFMRRIFKDNSPLVQKVLRIIIQKPDLKVVKSETQADMKRLAGARSICLDVLEEDDNGKLYDIEVQRDNKGADKHRARYHSSVMDVENLDAGGDFGKLPDTYVIFITEKDIFHMGLPVYPVERMNVMLNVPFNDGEHILYVNGAYRGDDDIGRLMHDFMCSNPDDMFDSDMAEATRRCKENPGGKIYVSAKENTLFTEIVVKDTGSGFVPSDIPHLFERFYKGSNASKDSFGIGLALARMIIAAQNGTIKATNYQDGACFCIRFYSISSV